MEQSTFKIKKQVKNLEELSEILKPHLSSKFDFSIDQAGSILKKVITNTDCDTLKIKKNAYHGVILTMQEPSEDLDYQVIGAYMYVPNFLLNQIVGHEGIIDKLICNLIFSKGLDLYDKLQETIINVLDGKRIDVGLINTTKAFLKGKSVYDEE